MICLRGWLCRIARLAQKILVLCWGQLPAMSHGGRRGLPKYHSHSKSPETQPGSLVPIRVARHSNMCVSICLLSFLLLLLAFCSRLNWPIAFLCLFSRSRGCVWSCCRSFPPRKLSSKSRSRKLHTAAVLSSKQVSASMPRGSNVGDTYLLQHARAYLFELLQQENAREVSAASAS